VRKLLLILGVLVLLGAAVFLAGFLLPSHRETTARVYIDAPPAAIFPRVASFKNGWQSWSAFGKSEDPGMELTFEGPDQGVGATERWHSQKMPDGQMKILTADPEHGVRYELVMPDFRIEGRVDFTRQPTTTQVVWTDAYDLGASPKQRWFGLLIDTMMAPKLQESLNELKRQVETKPAANR